MSNFDSTTSKKHLLNTDLANSGPITPLTKESSKIPLEAIEESSIEPLAHHSKERWSFVQSSLQNALADWNELEESNLINPEDEQLAKVKGIIADLKDKLNQF